MAGKKIFSLAVLAVAAAGVFAQVPDRENPEVQSGFVCPHCGHIEIRNEAPPASATCLPPEPVAAAEPAAVPASAAVEAVPPAKPALHDWTSSVYGGFAAKSGNTTESSYRYGGEFEKKNGMEYRYKLKLDGRYSKTDEQTTASKAELSGEMRRLLKDHWFVSGRLAGLHDDIKEISYRTKVGPGIGRYLADSEKLTADIGTGLLYIRESSSGTVSDYIAWRLSQRLDWQITEILTWWSETEFFVNTMDTGHYQVNFKSGVESKLNGHLSLVVAVEDDYDSLPERSGQVEKNDFEISTGVRYTL